MGGEENAQTMFTKEGEGRREGIGEGKLVQSTQYACVVLSQYTLLTLLMHANSKYLIV
jgi:hypothetical protein